jgi:hypothetical protein
MSECHEEVTRKGVLEPCGKPAVARRIDPSEGTPYPVCVKHARDDMVPLTQTELLPAESMALTVALAQVLRGDDPEPNVTQVVVYALARLAGRYDWTAGAA